MPYNIKDISQFAWSATYPIDGIHFGRSLVSSDPKGYSEWISANGKKYDTGSPQWNQVIRYWLHPLTQAAAFFGISNRMLDLDKGQSWKNIRNNFFGWQDNVSTGKKVANGFLALLRVPLNIVRIPFSLAVNIAKLVVEFLPAVVELELKSAAQREEKKNPYLSTFLKALSYVPHAIRYLARPITSPIQNVRDLWNKKRGLEAGLSIVLTALAYFVFFPLVVNAVAANILPVVAANLPTVMSHLPTWLAQVVSPILGGMTKAWSVVVKFPHIIGESLGYAVPTIGNAIDHFAGKLGNWFRGLGKPEISSDKKHGDVNSLSQYEKKPDNSFDHQDDMHNVNNKQQQKPSVKEDPASKPKLTSSQELLIKMKEEEKAAEDRKVAEDRKAAEVAAEKEQQRLAEEELVKQRDLVEKQRIADEERLRAMEQSKRIADEAKEWHDENQPKIEEKKIIEFPPAPVKVDSQPPTADVQASDQPSLKRSGSLSLFSTSVEELRDQVSNLDTNVVDEALIQKTMP